MPKTSIYLNNKNILISQIEIKRYFIISQVSLSQMMKTKKLKPISTEGKRFYKLTDVLKASAYFLTKEL